MPGMSGSSNWKESGMKTKSKSVILLSGGMDSTYAATWACRTTEPVAFLFVDYGQRGRGYEQAASSMVAGWLINAYKLKVKLHVAEVNLPFIGSSLLLAGTDLDPSFKDHNGKPLTFVPGRNLMMLSLAAGMAYQLGASRIVGGWTQVDVDYPDCTPDALQFAQRAINYALGTPLGSIQIVAPVLYRSKIAVVRYGREMGVPFHLTRSCYGDKDEACWKCDSCLLRAQAFMESNIRDPICPEDTWAELERRLNETTH